MGSNAVSVCPHCGATEIGKEELKKLLGGVMDEKSMALLWK